MSLDDSDATIFPAALTGCLDKNPRYPIRVKPDRSTPSSALKGEKSNPDNNKQEKNRTGKITMNRCFFINILSSL
ncbi:MAG: hypothetical protein DRN37_04245 [Thermoplasmata archaeon]|nr:MAG: hypothetical protein DRN37_04245 [Thermoplasmata archaeon]